MTVTILDIGQHNDCYTNPVRHLHSWPALNSATKHNCLQGKAGLTLDSAT